MKLYLVRHGETIANRQKIVQGQSSSTLTTLGRKQAELTAEYLRGMPFELVLVSDQSRAIKTAKAITKYHADIPVEQDERLRERSFGIFEGGNSERYFDYIRKYFEKHPKATFFQVPVPKGETMGQAQKRIFLYLDEIWRRHPNKTILVVTHGALLRLLIMYLKDMPEEKYYDESVKLQNASVTEITYNGKAKIHIDSLNYTKHLEGISLNQDH